jgi:hypothetical protein
VPNPNLSLRVTLRISFIVRLPTPPSSITAVPVTSAPLARHHYCIHQRPSRHFEDRSHIFQVPTINTSTRIPSLGVTFPSGDTVSVPLSLNAPAMSQTLLPSLHAIAALAHQQDRQACRYVVYDRHPRRIDPEGCTGMNRGHFRPAELQHKLFWVYATM